MIYFPVFDTKYGGASKANVITLHDLASFNNPLGRYIATYDDITTLPMNINDPSLASITLAQNDFAHLRDGGVNSGPGNSGIPCTMIITAINTTTGDITWSYDLDLGTDVTNKVDKQRIGSGTTSEVINDANQYIQLYQVNGSNQALITHGISNGTTISNNLFGKSVVLEINTAPGAQATGDMRLTRPSAITLVGKSVMTKADTDTAIAAAIAAVNSNAVGVATINQTGILSTLGGKMTTATNMTLTLVDGSIGVGTMVVDSYGNTGIITKDNGNSTYDIVTIAIQQTVFKTPVFAKYTKVGETINVAWNGVTAIGARPKPANGARAAKSLVYFADGALGEVTGWASPNLEVTIRVNINAFDATTGAPSADNDAFKYFGRFLWTSPNFGSDGPDALSLLNTTNCVKVYVAGSGAVSSSISVVKVTTANGGGKGQTIELKFKINSGACAVSRYDENADDEIRYYYDGNVLYIYNEASDSNASPNEGLPRRLTVSLLASGSISPMGVTVATRPSGVTWLKAVGHEITAVTPVRDDFPTDQQSLASHIQGLYDRIAALTTLHTPPITYSNYGGFSGASITNQRRMGKMIRFDFTAYKAASSVTIANGGIAIIGTIGPVGVRPVSTVWANLQNSPNKTLANGLRGRLSNNGQIVVYNDSGSDITVATGVYFYMTFDWYVSADW